MEAKTTAKEAVGAMGSIGVHRAATTYEKIRRFWLTKKFKI